MATPILIPRIKARLEISYVMGLGVIHGNERLKILIHVVNKRGSEGGRKDWVEMKKEGDLGGEEERGVVRLYRGRGNGVIEKEGS